MKKLIIFLVIILVLLGLVFSVGRELKGKIVFRDIFKLTPLYVPPGTQQQPTNIPPNAGVVQTPKQDVPPKIQEPPKPVPPDGFSINDLSPYYKKAAITGVVRPSYSSPRRGQFTIRFSGTNEESVDVTGWKVRGNRGGEVYIPQASEDFGISGWTPNGNIVLRNGNYVTVYSAKGPIEKNFRLNKCIGYLNNTYSFNPKLPTSCPSFDRKEIITFSGACQNFLGRMGGCKEPTAAEKNMFTGPADTACRAFLDTLNYGGCYRAHRSDKDFFSNEWRVWLNAEMFFDTEHDRLILYDKNGKVVNEYIY